MISLLTGGAFLTLAIIAAKRLRASYLRREREELMQLPPDWRPVQTTVIQTLRGLPR